MAPDFQRQFQPVEISETSLEHSLLRHLTFYSPALHGRGDVSIFIPRGTVFPAKLPLIVLLHGVYGSHWAWFLKGAAHLTAQAMIDSGEIRPMMIATPSDGLSGDGSGYWPRPHRDAERWIVEDVPACVREQFPSDGPLFLSGLSMGGYGALRLGFKYARTFKGISAHSSITRSEQMLDFVRERDLHLEEMAPGEPDILFWAEKHLHKLPPLRFDCGHDDSLFAANQELDRELTAMGISHRFDAFSGEHSWEYWKEHFAETLRFFDSLA
jgi:enterochelin esterase-like enzyme